MRIITTVIALLVLGGCASPSGSKSSVSNASGAILAGHWEGVAPDGSTVGYLFRKDGSVVWEIDGHSIHARYEAQVVGGLTEIDIFDFEGPQFEGVRFLGIAEIAGNKMKFFGVPTKNGKTQSGAPAIRPKEFGPDAIIFHRI